MSNLNFSLRVGIVVIGRNEGHRLVTCLDSLLNCVECIIYVDSGSSDNSLQEAEERGIECLSLDMNIPFTAARARNEGASLLIKKHPNLKYLQFIDGDCELQDNWIDKGKTFLEENSQYAIACGRRRERLPEHSVYNQLCDIEWDTPVGDAKACGGDALIKIDAYTQVGGYRNDMIAGEEPEMCFRLRQEGWMIRRLDVEMTLHDASMSKISQWWKKTVRTGYAFAIGNSIHGASKERYCVKEYYRVLFWGLFLPSLTLMLMLIHPLFFLLVLIYPLQIIRVFWNGKDIVKGRFLWASGIVLGKFPEAFGVLRFHYDQVRTNASEIIEYK